MYDVNGFPSTRTSTRRSASRGMTSTRGLTPCAWSRGAACCAPTATLTSSHALRICLCASSHHNIALRVIEHDLSAAVHRGNGHAQRDGMAVACVDARVGLLARAHALHPVPDIGGGRRNGAPAWGGVRGCAPRQVGGGAAVWVL